MGLNRGQDILYSLTLIADSSVMGLFGVMWIPDRLIVEMSAFISFALALTTPESILLIGTIVGSIFLTVFLLIRSGSLSLVLVPLAGVSIRGSAVSDIHLAYFCNFVTPSCKISLAR